MVKGGGRMEGFVAASSNRLRQWPGAQWAVLSRGSAVPARGELPDAPWGSAGAEFGPCQGVGHFDPADALAVEAWQRTHGHVELRVRLVRVRVRVRVRFRVRG